MKFNRWFVLFVVVFLGLVFLAEFRMPRKFVWNPTFSHNDKQPFGCYVFDSILSASLPHGYEVTKKSMYQMKDDTVKRGYIFMVSNQWTWDLGKQETNALLSLAEKGNKILVAYDGVNAILQDTLRYMVIPSFPQLSLREYVMQGKSRDTIVWEGDSVYDRRSFYFYPQVMASRVKNHNDSLPVKQLATIYHSYQNALSDDVPVTTDTASAAMSISVGKGEIIVVSTPLIFTNYGILDAPNHEYIFRILSEMGDLPIVRTEAYTKTTEENSPLRYFLSQPPLRWAVTLGFIAILVFMVFTARRRQRVIPEVEKPKNRNLEFVKLIGTLYYQKHDYRDLVLKKYAYFAEEMRRVLHVDLTDKSEDLRTFSVIATQTGMEEQEVSKLVNTVRQLEDDEEAMVSRTTMESLINQITTIWKRTNQEPTSPSSQRR